MIKAAKDATAIKAVKNAFGQHAALVALWSEASDLGEPCDILEQAALLSVELMYQVMQEAKGNIPTLTARRTNDRAVG